MKFYLLSFHLITAALFFAAAITAFASGKGNFPVYADVDEPRSVTIQYDAGVEEVIRPLSLPPQVEMSRAELVMKSIAAAYPRRVGEAVFRNGDWAVSLRGLWFYYADGRLLPEALRTRSAEFSPQPFYAYPQSLPPWKKPLPEDAVRLSEASKQRQSGRLTNRSLFFYDTLWKISTKAEAWDRVKTTRFLGKSILVHYGIMEELALIEQRINTEAKRDSKVQAWIDELNSITAWNWRNIADVKTRSNHAYGIAIDLLPAPKAYQSLETYWLWTEKNNGEWWNVPYSRRYHPPEAVIRAFEDYGFIWGGKWSFYDTMHFEYRPEILILNGIDITGEY